MEAGCLEEPAWSWAQRGQQEGSAQRQEESGQRLPELGDACVGAAEPQQPQLPPGKLKKTALKLFGGKRSICTLPSFFGGRSKGQGKATSKKGLSKCQTHDGLSAAVCDKGGTTQPESPLEGSSDSQACLLPSSQSAHMALAPSTKLNLGRRDSSPPGSIEGGEKKPTGEKSSCPRAKKGLRGFFNSIRRHRKSKAAEGEKAELAEWNGALEKAVKAPGVGLASEGAVEGRGLGAAPLPAAVPGSADDDGSVGTAADCGEAAQPSALPVDGGSSEGDAEVLAGRGDVPGTTSKADAVVCAEFDNSNQLLAFHPDFLDTDPACLHSGDLLNLILGDVASLKSFDSLTGCGDDIAEPDIAESTLSVGHSRDAAKRSSCLVTFQGGGEEMAIPEEAEDFLPEPWDSRAAEDRSYGAQVLRSSLETHASHEAAVLPYVGEAMDGLDLLTPQSDQQESAPNSDEGYYDSTTPGLEDEAGDGLGELKKDRLPRDSYSGDALYEFDALMSPSHREESLFESKVSRPEIFSCFLDLCLPAEESLVQMLDQKRGLMETEEERLVAIQKELLYWELQREPVMKRLVVPNKEKCPREKPCIECESRAASCVGKNQSSLGREQVGSHPPPRCANDGGLGAQAEDPEWRDFPWTPCPETCYGSQKAQGSCLIQLPQENAGFDLDLDHELSGGSIQGGAAPAEAGVFPGCRLPEQERSDRADAPGEPAVCSEPEHTVSFSQALVEFASSGTLFSSLSESLGSSGSGSSFTQNLPALPTMVTFDVVDVEQEGEGECEQHPELNGGEDIAEAFDDGFSQKESLAECEEPTSPGCVPGSFLSGSWGVASLPRHLRLHGLSPCWPAPLSLDRRSRSLDTESLEFELASLQVARNGPQPGQPWAKQEGGRKDTCGVRRSRSKGEGVLVAPDGGSSWPGSQHLQHDCVTAAGRSELWGLAAAVAMESVWEPSEQPGTVSPFPSLSCSVAGETLDRRPLLRPSSLPLQSEGRCSWEVDGSSRHHGEASAKTVAHEFLPGELEPNLSLSFGFASSLEKSAKCRPVGIAQGVPQHPSVSSDTGKSPECCGDGLKGRALPGHTVPAVSVTGAE
ncbi:APC membrane recruitment protein 1 isoform X1 [Cuculus canorus]|nr:APC membrane recruitment protein 1 isoform X1 [Cuculus canorus]XP_053931739.1 APC membrane recruitment protein 1 isoform X1 [Cuculus canorus]